MSVPVGAEKPAGGMVDFDISFDGTTIACREGWSVAAALIAAGIVAWRSTRHGDRPRGLFCGIGVCFDCLVTVNDQPSLRACLVLARPGDVVRSQRGTGR